MVVATNLLLGGCCISLRIPKGSDRRPKSLERRQFMEIIAKGISICADYRPFHAPALAVGRRHRPKELKVVTHP